MFWYTTQVFLHFSIFLFSLCFFQVPKYLTMFSSTLFALFPLLLAPTALSDKDLNCERTALCLTTFKWCDWRDDCDYPENVYSLEWDRQHVNSLIWEKEYDVSWTTNDTSIPVTIQWLSYAEPKDEKSNELWKLWETSTFYLSCSCSSFILILIWEDAAVADEVSRCVDITDKSTSYKFKPSSNMFPSPLLPNTTFIEARGIALTKSVIIISQSKDPNKVHFDDQSDRSDAFIVTDGITREIIEHARDQVRRRWRKRTAIALGLGIVATWAVAFTIGHFIGKWTMRKRVEAGGYKAVQGGRSWLNAVPLVGRQQQ